MSPPEAAYWGLKSCLLHGVAQSSRGMVTREIQNFTVMVMYPQINSMLLPGRNLNPVIGALEACQLIGQISSPESITRRVKAFEPFLDEGIFWGSYGNRASTQLSRAERLLRDDPGTRQSVISLYEGQRDLRAEARDVPCTLTLQFLWEAPRVLSLRVSMRSNDAFLGLPYDLFQFTSLQCAMADALDAEVGTYVHTVGSMHLYMRDMDRAREVQAPGAPVADEMRRKRMWNGDSIGDVSSRARTLLFGLPLEDLTEFESYLQGLLK